MVLVLTAVKQTIPKAWLSNTIPIAEVKACMQWVLVNEKLTTKLNGLITANSNFDSLV